MKSTLRHYAAAAVAALGFSLPASATSYGTDYTDLWWNPGENGWGVNLIQQYGTLFATLFVYGTDNSPRWYVASQLEGSPNSFSGALYQTTGPAFSAPWTGGQPPTAVGSMSVAFSGSNSGTLTYTVNGVTVSKAIQRQTFRSNVITGNYLGGMVARVAGCPDPDNLGALMTGLLTVSHAGGNHSMFIEFKTITGSPATCTFNGGYTPKGRLATISGTFNCTLGNNGTFTMDEVEVNRNGFTATFTGSDQFCSYNGYFGGVRDVL